MFHIITVYDSLNYGSFFQARALQWELEKYGVVDFVNIHHQNTLYQTIRSCGAKLIKGKLASARLEQDKYRAFAAAKKSFPIIDIRRVTYKKGEFYFFGSDEIWNISRKKIKKSKEFFGKNLPEKIRVAIAPSINQSGLLEFQNNNYVVEELKKFYAVSVRDKHSKDVLEEITGRNFEILADPTLLHTKQEYVKFQSSKVPEGKFILLYTYGRMLKPHIAKILRIYADKNGLKLISVGRWFDFCDENIGASPEEFLSYFDCAEGIITDTFHGLMFSLIYEKKFLVFPCGNIKVEETLDILELKDRMYSENISIQEKMADIIDYSSVSLRVQEFGDKTRSFLKKVLEENASERIP